MSLLDHTPCYGKRVVRNLNLAIPLLSPAPSVRSHRKVWHLTGLKELWLTNNDIRMLPPQIRELRHLRTLGVGRNRISR